jgi:hypothetical protein
MIPVLICSLFACIYTVSVPAAADAKDKQEARDDLRILELLPNLISPLAVDPGIPANFVAAVPKGVLDLYDWIYWGPKDVLQAYFANPASLKEPILRVKLSANIVQKGPDSFSDEESLKVLKKQDPKAFASIKTKWGNYPVHAIRTALDNRLIFMAWVGLNDPEAGWTLMFNLVYPDGEGHPNKEDRQLWENLIKKTTQLQDQDYFKVYGQDLQEGYTLVNVHGAKLKILAEKRQPDGEVCVLVIPESPDVKFRYIGMQEGLMGATWKYGEPMLKVYGEITTTRGNMTTVSSYITSILLKNVPEFSFQKEKGKKDLIFTKKAS